MKTNWLDYTLLSLLIVGGINWGLIGFLNLNLVDFLFGNGSLLARITYIVIGICGILNIALLIRPISTDSWVEEN